MTVKLEEGDNVPLTCRHCSSVTLEVMVKEGSWVRRCRACKEQTIVKIERRRGNWEVYTGTVPKGLR